MVDIESLSEGDALEHKQSGAVREVSGFVKDFSGERGSAKLRRNRNINHAVGKSDVNEAGHKRLERGDGDEWELLEVDG
jgi:hypothetical protein